MDINFFFVNALNGVVYGAFLLLTSLGLSLVFGLGRVVNFAHGALYALGGYALVTAMQRLGASFWVALLLAPLPVTAVAIAIERATIHPIRDRPEIYTLLVTFGMTFMLIGAIEHIWGTGTSLVRPPSSLQGTIQIFGNRFPIYRLVAAAISLLMSAGVFAFIQFTPIGLRIRAITDDPGMAQAIGINTQWLLTLVFGAAAGLAAFAGGLGAPIFAVHPDMGSGILLDAFLAVILGGLGNLPGTATGAMFVALTKSIGGGYIAEWSIAVLFALVAVALIFRPTGLFGQGRAA
jgi:branched-subunit amino acid ABC-type transport system permease component